MLCTTESHTAIKDKKCSSHQAQAATPSLPPPRPEGYKLSTRKNYKYWLEVAADKKVWFNDLPLLVGRALNQLDNVRKPIPWKELTEIRYELSSDVQNGKLIVCHPNTLMAYSPPVQEQDLDSAVLIPEDGLRLYLGATRGIELRIRNYGLGPDYWT
jgi:hypothetical protein